MDDLYKLLNEVSIDENDFEEVKVTQLEKEKVKKNLKLSISSNKNNHKKYFSKKVFISLASSIVIIITIVLINSNTIDINESSDSSYSIMINMKGNNYYFDSYLENNENLLGDYIGSINNKVSPDIFPKANESNYFDDGTKVYEQKNGNGIISVDKDGNYILLKKE